jgi:hypothetical protein
MIVKKFLVFFVAVFLVGTTFSSSFVLAQSYGYGGSTTYQPKPSFNTYYGSNAQTYWPILGDQETCQARQDIILNVAPAGCQPAVVRSDLLAEQDVPVFCQIDSFEINPLIDIKQIRNMRFGGDYPSEVKGVGFHPARAALRTHNQLLGSPLVNNVGYVVVVLKRQPEESKLPDFVNVTLNADLEYTSGNAYGVGRSEFNLRAVSSEAEWQKEKLRNSFWEGRYYVRVESMSQESATISIYYGDQKVTTRTVKKGQTSNRIFLPGLYCQAGLQIAFDDLVGEKKKARIEVSSDGGVDGFDVYEGTRFMDDRCVVKDIEITGDSGKVTGNCKGESFVLELKSKNDTTKEGIVLGGKEYEVKFNGLYYSVDLTDLDEASRKGNYILDEEDNLINVDTGITILNSKFMNDESMKEEDETWFRVLYDKLFAFKNQKVGVTESKNLTGINEYYDKAIDAYEDIVDSYPNEPNVENSEKYGEKALARAISLAGEFGRDFDRTRLINKYLEAYPQSNRVPWYLSQLSSLENVDSSGSWEAIDFDDKSRVIRLVPGSFVEPSKTPSARLIVGSGPLDIEEEETKNLNSGGAKYGNITLESVSVGEAKVSAVCDDKKGRKTFVLKQGEKAKEVCEGLPVKLDQTNIDEVAKVRILPFAEHTKSQSTFAVNIGIEKRAIKLNPDKALEKIEELNKTLEKWEDISDNLGKVVTGLKGACFATATALTFKNFMSGLSGGALARQEVMNGENGWTNRCKDMVANGEKGYTTINQCYLGEAANINSDVNTVSGALSGVNGKIQSIQNNHVTGSSVLGKSVNTDGVVSDMASQIKLEYGGGKTITTQWIDKNGNVQNQVTLDEMLADENVKSGLVTPDSLRSLWLNLELEKSGGLSSGQASNVGTKLSETAKIVNDNMIADKSYKNSQELNNKGLASSFFATNSNQESRIADVVKLNSNTKSILGDKFGTDITHSSTVSVVGSTVGKEGSQATFKTGRYILGNIEDGAGSGQYVPKEVLFEEGGSYTKLSDKDASAFLSNYGVGRIRETKGLSYVNKIAPGDRIVKYYNNEPYKGMPAVVPFDVNEGWYAGTRQTLPAFGGIGAFDASGRVTSFWICNVGDNGRIEFETGFGDDLCQQVNLNTGQPLGSFPGKSEIESKALVNKAVNAIQQAANRYGQQYVNINGQEFKTDITTGVPGTQCQDFMSPNDCHLMFNVCDPVICPSSRCDFGGTYRVANVAQTGIVGSALLCLPNIKEGIAIPVCLTGIHAGVEGLTSIMRNYRDCLQENVETGQLVGICDQIYSIYLCEFLWNQVAPFVNILIPKIVEIAYGQGTRGGAEYLTVMSAWQNMQNSVDYFTQSYAVNSLKAFQARSVSEAGGEVCKAFISAKAPDTFKSLLEPDSPPQFHAWFDQKTFTTATVPATSQYKVFYHIFAGRDQGIQFSVYLRNPPESSYYSTAPTIQVASDFVPRGEYASETRDFTAPEGYKELCVRINNEEECGFKQVSTSFAINSLRDGFVANELQNKNIQSEEACISGASNPGALLTPNIQSGVEEVISPDIYNRGVVRICGTENPGSGTDPTRFVDVGHCGDQKIRCWLDERSVEKAITGSNLGLKEETLEVLEQQMKSNFEKEGLLMNPDEAGAELYSLEEALVGLKNSKDKLADAKSILERIDVVDSMIYVFEQKAKLLLIKGQVNELVARDLLTKEYVKIRAGRPKETGQLDSEAVQSLESKKDPVPKSQSSTTEQGITAKVCVEDNDGLVVPESQGCSIGQDNIGDVTDLHYKAVCCFGQEESSAGECGNSVIDGTEECDGADLGGFDCTTWTGKESIGELGCIASLESNECKFDVSDCKPVESEEEEEIQSTVPEEEVLNCELSNPRWADENGNEVDYSGVCEEGTGFYDGDLVYLVVDVNGGCAEKSILFNVFENELFFDDLQSTFTGSSELFGGEVSSAEIELDWFDDGFFQGNPELYFKAEVQELKTGKSPELEVCPLLEVSEEGDDDDTGENGIGCGLSDLEACKDSVSCENVGGKWDGSCIAYDYYNLDNDKLNLGENYVGVFFSDGFVYDNNGLIVGTVALNDGKIKITNFNVESSILSHLQLLQNGQDAPYFYLELDGCKIREDGKRVSSNKC